MMIAIGDLRINQPLLRTLPELPGLYRKDHVAFVVSPENEDSFAKFWESKGLQRLETLITEKYPARHTGFIDPKRSDEPMVALSVSDDPQSPINLLIKKHGEYSVTEDSHTILGLIQHIAYGVDSHITSIENIEQALTDNNFTFITPLLTYATGEASLKQGFATSEKSEGVFIEILERTALPVATSDKKQGFDARQIDRLYSYLDEYYHRLHM